LQVSPESNQPSLVRAVDGAMAQRCKIVVTLCAIVI
jgi:hypothetical protein